MRALLDVVELGSFSAAARRLNLTQLSRTLALVKHRNKANEPALGIVRSVLLELRTDAAIEPKTEKRRRNKPNDASG